MQHREPSLRDYGDGEDGRGRPMSERLSCATSSVRGEIPR
jgi:hypothetical protein